MVTWLFLSLEVRTEYRLQTHNVQCSRSGGRLRTGTVEGRKLNRQHVLTFIFLIILLLLKHKDLTKIIFTGPHLFIILIFRTSIDITCRPLIYILVGRRYLLDLTSSASPILRNSFSYYSRIILVGIY